MEENLLTSSVRETIARFDDEYWLECDQNLRFPIEFHDALAAGGWLGLAIPEEYGGGGLGISEAALLLETIAQSGAGMNGCSAIHLTIFGMNVVVKHGTDAMKAELLPRVADGSLQVCFGVTEPDAGSDTTRISTAARRDGDKYLVNGKKVWITKAGESDKILLLVRTSPFQEGKRRTEGLSLLLADLDENVVMRPIPKMGRNAVASYELFFDDWVVPASCLVGEEGMGFRYLLDGLNPERILLADESLGIGKAALAKAIDYAGQREVFGHPIGQNQGIQFPLAQAHARLESARLMARKAAQLYDAGEPCAGEAAMAKYLCADAGFFAADRAVQTHGGYGYAREYHVERYFREARLLQLAPISQEMALNFIGQHVLKLPRSY